MIRASEGAGLLVVGLSERWREEGLGPVRAEIVKAAPAPILLVGGIIALFTTGKRST